MFNSGGTPPEDMDDGGSTEAGSPSTNCPNSRGHLRVTVYYRTRTRHRLEGANVELSGGAGSQQTNSRGRAEFRSLATGSYNIRVTGDNIVEATATGTVVADRTSRVDVEVQPLGTLRVRVIDADDNPIERATVSIQGQSDGTTDSQGQYDFTNMRSARFQIRASKAGYIGQTEMETIYFDPGEVVEAEVELRTITLSIRDRNGEENPCRIIGVGNNTQFKAVPSPDISGTYQWSSTSTKITLTNDTSQTVTVTAGNQVSSGLDAETLQVVFTPGGSPAMDPVSINLTVIKVVYSEATSQNYGYDDMDNVAGVEHHVSVERDGSTTVHVSIDGGVNGSDLIFDTNNDSIAQVEVPSGAGSSFDLTVNGGSRDKDEATIRAKCRCVGNPACGTMKVNVYKLKEVSATVAKVYDSTSASTNLSQPNFDVVSAATFISTKYKAAVAEITFTDQSPSGGAVDIHYDLGTPSGDGLLTLEAGGTGPEIAAINAAFNPSGQKVVIVRDMIYVFYLQTAAAAGDNSITLRNYGGNIDFLLNGVPYNLGTGASQESITISSRAGNVLNLASPLSNAHPTTDGVIFPVGGLGGNPVLIVEASCTSEDLEKWTLGHECGHALLGYHDMDATDNQMHFQQGSLGYRLRYKSLLTKYPPQVNESQWEMIRR